MEFESSLVFSKGQDPQGESYHLKGLLIIELFLYSNQ